MKINLSFLSKNIIHLLYSFMAKTLIPLGCGQNKTMQDFILGFEE